MRISPFDQAARRHTSFASLYVWPELPEDVDIEIDEKDLRIDTYRSSGAGGQHVNVTDSAVRITHLPTGIVVSCQNERSQHRNRDSAMKVLKARLYDLKMKEQQAKLEQISGVEEGHRLRQPDPQLRPAPYQLVKDHRTKEQVGDVNRVLDGDIDVLHQDLSDEEVERHARPGRRQTTTLTESAGPLGFGPRLKRLGSESLVYGLSSIVGRLLGYLLQPYYAHQFDPAQNGVQSVVYVYIPIISIALYLGMDIAYMRNAASVRDAPLAERQRVFTMSLRRRRGSGRCADRARRCRRHPGWRRWRASIACRSGT